MSVLGGSAHPLLLIVDDNAANLRLYRAILKDCGADLLLAQSGEEALMHAAAHSFAMVLLDVHLSGALNGFEVARRLAELGGDAAPPIVFVSAVYTHSDDTFRGYRLGAVDYILSPVVPEILRSKASVFIRLHRMRSDAHEHALAMELAYRELRLAHTELEHFSFSASHDLRAPLRHIAGFAELVLQDAGSDSGVRKGYLRHILEATGRMNRLIDDLLMLSKISRAEVRGVSVDLTSMVNEIATELVQTEPQRTVQWTIASGLEAEGDPGLLRTAVSNLLSNAWKYSEGAPAPQIEVGRLAAPSQGVFFVRDNGVGFDLEAAKGRLFRPFQRFHSDSRFKGTGIGLSIVHRVVAKHGGEIWAESAPGRGTSFFFTLDPSRRNVRPDLQELE
jgi:signal transduction histidine kinase